MRSDRRRETEGLEWKRLKNWDLSVLMFCGRAKVTLGGCEGDAGVTDVLGDGFRHSPLNAANLAISPVVNQKY